MSQTSSLNIAIKSRKQPKQSITAGNKNILERNYLKYSKSKKAAKVLNQSRTR